MVVTQLGLKALMFASLVRRPIAAALKNGITNRYATWLDTLGLDSQYDYDPVWAKCVDMAAVLPEAHELVDEGLMAEEDFSDFVFGNAVRLWGSADPDFFKGTVIEKQAAEYLVRENTPQRSAAVGA